MEMPTFSIHPSAALSGGFGYAGHLVFLYGDPQAVQNAVDESTGFFGAEAFADIDGFIDGHLGWNVGAKEQFERGDSQHIAIHAGHA